MLSSMATMISEHKPVIMVEYNKNLNETIFRLMSSLGYRCFSRSSEINKLSECDFEKKAQNYWYIPNVNNHALASAMG